MRVVNVFLFVAASRVMQERNLLEMLDFVQLGKELGVDWSHMPMSGFASDAGPEFASDVSRLFRDRRVCLLDVLMQLGAGAGYERARGTSELADATGTAAIGNGRGLGAERDQNGHATG